MQKFDVVCTAAVPQSLRVSDGKQDHQPAQQSWDKWRPYINYVHNKSAVWAFSPSSPIDT